MGKKWGHYRAGGRSQPVECIYCGRLTPRIKAMPIRRHFGLGMRSQDMRTLGIDARRVFIPSRKGYVCISCAKHRGLL